MGSAEFMAFVGGLCESTNALPCVKMITLISHMLCVCLALSCARLGMVVIKEGSPTADRVCGKPASQPILNPMIATPDIPYTTAPSLSPPIHKLHSVQSDNPSGLSTMLQFSSQNPVTSLASETTVPSGVSAEVAATPGGTGMYSDIIYFILFSRYFLHPSQLVLFQCFLVSWTAWVFFIISPTEGPVLPHETLLKKTTYIILTLLLLTLCLMTYLFLKRKSRAIKNKLAWAGVYPQCTAHTLITNMLRYFCFGEFAKKKKIAQVPHDLQVNKTRCTIFFVCVCVFPVPDPDTLWLRSQVTQTWISVITWYRSDFWSDLDWVYVKINLFKLVLSYVHIYGPRYR